MTQFLVVNDLHIGSKYCDDPMAKTALDNLVNDGKTILNGDIVDRSASPKKDQETLAAYMKSLIKKWGDAYISGNHELSFFNTKTYRITTSGKKVMFTHGDLIKDFDKWSAYRMKTPGAGLIKLLWVAFADTQDWVKDKINTAKLEPMFKNAAAKAKEAGCDYIVMGHLHPNKAIDVVRDGVRIMILPKGFNTIELE